MVRTTLTPERQIRRIRRLLWIAGIAAILLGVPLALESRQGFGICARFAARVAGYQGCECRDCQEALLPWYGSPVRDQVREMISMTAKLPVALIGFVLGSGYVDPWVAGCNLLIAGLAMASFAMFGRRVIARGVDRLVRNPLNCVRCGYDVRGLSTRICPECGSALSEVPMSERGTTSQRG